MGAGRRLVSFSDEDEGEAVTARNIPLHRQWVARSYGFIFIAARAPDFFHVHWQTHDDFVDFLWMLVFLALVVPDIILQWNDLWRRRAKPRAD